MSEWPELSGCRIQRIDRPAAQMFSFSLGRRDFRASLVVVLSGDGAGVGLCEQRPKGNPADAFVQRLRKHIGGARVEHAGTASPGQVRLSLGTRQGARCLELQLSRREGNVRLRDAAGQPMFSLHPEESTADTRGVELPDNLEALRQRGPHLVATAGQASLADVRKPLSRAIARRIRSLNRRLAAIDGDAERAKDADRLRSHATLVLSNLHALDANAREATLLDPTTDPPREVALRFETALGPKQSAEAWFKRARRLARGAVIAAERRVQTEQEIAGLQALRGQLDATEDPDRIEELRQRARAFGVEHSASAPSTDRARERVPYREYVSLDGLPILVGRGARDNDALTVRLARPHDHFFHVRGVPGAHVIVRLQRGESCPPETLLDAATLAAHFCGLRGEALVEVAHTARRHVRKPKGAAPGSVLVRSEKVLQLRADAARLARLLDSHRA